MSILSKLPKSKIADAKSIAWFHDIAIDKEGNIYVGDILGNTIQKFKKLN